MKARGSAAKLGLSLVSLAALLSSCSTANVSRYVPDSAAVANVDVVAIFPMVVRAAARTDVVSNYGPTWIFETATTAPMSPAEYGPAEQELVDFLMRRAQHWRYFEPAVVERTMRGSQYQTLSEAIRGAAERLKADHVLICNIRNLELRENSFADGKPHASGHFDLTLYSRTGEVVWSVSAEATKMASTVFSRTPNLTDFVKYSLEKVGPHIPLR